MFSLGISKCNLGVYLLGFVLVFATTQCAAVPDVSQYVVAIEDVFRESYSNSSWNEALVLIPATSATLISLYNTIKKNSQVFLSFITPEETRAEQAKITNKYAERISNSKNEYKSEVEKLSMPDLQTVCDKRGITVETREADDTAREEYENALCNDFYQRVNGYENMLDLERYRFQYFTSGVGHFDLKIGDIVWLVEKASIESKKKFKELLQKRTESNSEFQKKLSRRYRIKQVNFSSIFLFALNFAILIIQLVFVTHSSK